MYQYVGSVEHGNHAAVVEVNPWGLLIRLCKNGEMLTSQNVRGPIEPFLLKLEQKVMRRVEQLAADDASGHLSNLLYSLNPNQGASKMNEETRSFLIDLSAHLRGHGHTKAAQDVLDHIDDQDNKA